MTSIQEDNCFKDVVEGEFVLLKVLESLLQVVVGDWVECLLLIISIGELIELFDQCH